MQLLRGSTVVFELTSTGAIYYVQKALLDYRCTDSTFPFERPGPNHHLKADLGDEDEVGFFHFIVWLHHDILGPFTSMREDDTEPTTDGTDEQDYLKAFIFAEKYKVPDFAEFLAEQFTGFVPTYYGADKTLAEPNNPSLETVVDAVKHLPKKSGARRFFVEQFARSYFYRKAYWDQTINRLASKHTMAAFEVMICLQQDKLGSEYAIFGPDDVVEKVGGDAVEEEYTTTETQVSEANATPEPASEMVLPTLQPAVVIEETAPEPAPEPVVDEPEIVQEQDIIPEVPKPVDEPVVNEPEPEPTVADPEPTPVEPEPQPVVEPEATPAEPEPTMAAPEETSQPDAPKDTEDDQSKLTTPPPRTASPADEPADTEVLASSPVAKIAAKLEKARSRHGSRDPNILTGSPSKRSSIASEADVAGPTTPGADGAGEGEARTADDDVKKAFGLAMESIKSRGEVSVSVTEVPADASSPVELRGGAASDADDETPTETETETVTPSASVSQAASPAESPDASPSASSAASPNPDKVEGNVNAMGSDDPWQNFGPYTPSAAKKAAKKAKKKAKKGGQPFLAAEEGTA